MRIHIKVVAVVLLFLLPCLRAAKPHLPVDQWRSRYVGLGFGVLCFLSLAFLFCLIVTRMTTGITTHQRVEKRTYVFILIAEDVFTSHGVKGQVCTWNLKFEPSKLFLEIF